MVKKQSLKFETQALKKLEEIVYLLNLIVELNVPPVNIKGLKLGKVEKAVLDLCDLRHTTDEMASKLKKKPGHISKTLTGLKKKGLIKSVKVEGRTCYIRVKR